MICCWFSAKPLFELMHEYWQLDHTELNSVNFYPIRYWIIFIQGNEFENAVCKMMVIHYCDVIIGAMASLITSLTSFYSTVHSGADQRKHQSSASLAFVRGIHRRPVNSPHKWPVTRKIFPFDDVIMVSQSHYVEHSNVSYRRFETSWSSDVTAMDITEGLRI